MMSKSSGCGKAPPVLKEGGNYSSWKHQLQCWEILTDIPAEKRGLSVYLNALEGGHKEVVSKLSVTELSSATGVLKITTLLDRYCDDKKAERQYNTYSTLHNFKRKPQESISDALIRFESIVCDCEALEIQLPTPVLAFHVLNAMNIGEENMKLARATISDLTYENMVSQIRSIMDKSTSSQVQNSDLSEIKVEPDDTLYTRGNFGGRRARGFRRGRAVRTNYGRGSGGITEDRRCYNCGQYGHLSYDCPSKGTNSSMGTIVENSGNSGATASGGETKGRCFKCNSPDHFAYACPSESTGVNQGKRMYLTFLEINSDSKVMSSFIGETLGCAVVDCGAKSNVTGNVWLDQYIDTLSESEKSEIKEEKWPAKFRFGDGKEVESDVKITVPVKIGGLKQTLTTSVVKKDLPLLLSFESLNRNSAVIDFGNLSMSFEGKQVSLKRTQSGHLLLPLSDMSDNCANIILQVRNLENLSQKEKETKMKKLHVQLNHAVKEPLIRLLRSSGIEDKGMEEAVIKVCDQCNFCLHHKRKPLRPCVTVALSEGFNNTVAMDLITYVKDKVYVLHLICLGTKYSAASVIRGKLGSTILKGVLRIWIHYFGAPHRFLTDNGGEFSNDEFRELCEKFNIVSITTPGESPWSNGVCERHNGVLMETVRRVMDECQCDLESALPWAVSTKNTLSNISGYSPNVLVFGRNPNEPSVLHDSIPAMEPCTASEIVRKNMNLRAAARKAYIAADSSERIRRALRMKLRTSNSTVVNNGDSVFYRREKSDTWRGPGIVIGSDSQLVIVRRGGQV